MENLKIKVNNEAESKEAQELFFELGCSFRGSENKNIEIFKHIGIFYLYAYSDGDLTFSNESDLFLSMKDHKEITLSQLRDMVVLKRKSWKDATHETDRDDNDDLYYVSSDGRIYYWFCGDHWVYSGYCYRGNLKPISKTKEYLVKDPETNFYYVSNGHDDFGVVCEIPEGAEVVCYSELNKEFIFYKDNGEYQFDKKWIKCGVEDESGTTYNNLTDFLKWGEGNNEIIWKRNAQDEEHTKVDHSELFDKIRSGEVDLKFEKPNVENTLQERAKTYGSFEDVAMLTQDLLSVMKQHGYDDMSKPHKESLHMICSKIARIVNGDQNHKDSWHDIGGYAKLIEDLIG